MLESDLETNWESIMLCRSLILVAALAAVAADDANKKDLARMQGTWKVKSLTEGSKEAPAEEVAKMKFVIDGNKMTVYAGETKAVELTVKLDASKNPAAIDLRNDEQKETMLAIYQLGGDTLKICGDRPGKERPTEFEVKAGTEMGLIVLQREKK
jgi:uncharacterized protein (TIGR03067 family)